MLLLLALIGPVLSIFSETTHRFTVSEDAPAGSFIGRVPLQSGIEFRPSGLPPEIRLDHGDIFLSSPVDREVSPSLTFSIISTSPPVIIHVSIEVEDVNDNAPAFPLAFQNVSVLETAPVGTRLSLLAAVDADEGENGRIAQYRLQKESEVFSLIEEEGLIFLELQKPLDREEQQFYFFNLSATDAGERVGWISVYLQVLDVNDCAPEFGEKRISVSWNGQKSSPILTLNATDQDEGENAHLHYEILGSSDDFELLGNEIYAKVDSPNCCERAPCAECTITVRAVDGGNPPLSSTVEIVIKFHGDNQHDPEIQIRLQSSNVDFAVVGANSEKGKAVAVLTVTDEDGPFTGSLKILEDGENLFNLTSQSGFFILRLAVPGSQLTKPEYRVIFEADDSQGRRSRKALTIYSEVQNVTENLRLKEVHVSAKIPEDSPKGSFVVQIGANSNGQRFEMTKKKEGDLFVEIDDINGIVVTSTDTLLPGRYSFDISVFPPPPAVKPYITTLDLLIEDINNHRPFILVPESVKISERTEIGSEILTFEVKDADLGNNGKVTVAILEGGEYMKIGKNSLILRKELDFEEEKEFTIILEAKDNGKMPLSSRKRIIFHVEDSNDQAPFFPCQDLHFTISNLSPIATEIGQVVAVDNDSQEITKLSYSLLDPTLLFTVNAANGKIFIAKQLEEKTYHLRIRALDQGGMISSNNITVHIHSTSHTLPKFKGDLKFMLKKDIQIGMEIGKLDGIGYKTDSSLISISENGEIRLKNIHKASIFWSQIVLEKEGLSISKCVEFEMEKKPAPPRFLKKKLEFNITSETPLGFQLERIEACRGSCFYSTDCLSLSIDSHGILSLAGIVSTDKMICKIKARDGENREDSIDVIVRKEKGDEFFHLPVFHEFFIYPDLPLGTIIGRLPSSTSYFYSAGRTEAIGIFPDGVLYIRSDLKPLEVYSFTAEATHKRLGNKHKTEVWIRAQESMKREILCPEGSYSILENNLAGGTITILGYPPSIKIRQLDAHDKVLITPIGRVLSLVSFDAEKVENFTLKMELIQGTKKRQCSLTIKIEDDNEFPPKFERRFYSTSLPFGTSSGVIGAVSAIDLDREGKDVTYRLMSHQEFLKINNTTGEISVISPLPGDSLLNVSIRAIDSGTPRLQSSAFFLVSTQENPTLPIHFLENSTIRISLTAEIGSIVGRSLASAGQKTLQIETKDPRFFVDSFGYIRLLERPRTFPKELDVLFTVNDSSQLRKIIISDSISVKENKAPVSLQSVPSGSKIALLSPPTDSILLDGNNLLLEKPLDREDVDFYQILLENNGFYSLLNMEVEDEKDYPPSCGNNVFLVENVPAMVKINCWDEETNSTLHFGLKTKIPGILVKPDGIVKIERLEEVVTQLDLDVSDRKTKPISATITLIKKRTDKSITFPADNFNLLLSSSLENGQSFGRVAAEAGGKNVDYFLLGSDALGVNKMTGELLVLDKKEIKKRPVIREVILVASSRIGMASVRIRVETIEDFLFLPRNTFIFQAKSRLLGGFIGKIETGREDVELETRDDRFFLQNGSLIVRRSLKNETEHLLVVEIEARKGRIAAKVTAYVVLAKGSSSLEFRVPENVPKGFPVGQAPSGFEQIDGNVPLLLDEEGIIRTAEILDREKTDSYNFSLKSEAGEYLFSILMVDDENDNPPVLQSTKIELKIAEDQEIGSALTRILFDDPDTNNFFHFTIEEGNEMNQFEIDQLGLLKLKGSLDYETERIHRLKILLSDGIAPFPQNVVSCEVLITVLDVNDSPPQITSATSFTVQENTALGSTIGAIIAADPDSPFLTYRIVPDTLPYGEIVIDPIYGYLQINKELDYERRKNYSFDVEISDVELATRKRITVIVLDKNDNAPRFKGKETNFTVKETARVGYEISRMEIEDADSLDNSDSFFWLTGLNSSLFRVGETSGILFVAGRLDFERERTYLFTIHARNIAEGTAIISRNVTITIEDENDEAPRFLKGSPEVLEIYENLAGPFPMVISNSVSEDDDQGDVVAYSLLSGNSSLFGVDAKTGDILLLKSLDREEEERHSLSILATDSGRPRKSATAEISVMVLDENDHSPAFLQPYYSASIVENVENGTVILQVEAKDLDIERNGEVSYQILEKNVPFWINPETGKILIRGKIDREEKEIWEITVEARDNGQYDQLFSTISVRIKVEDVNDNPPVIRNTQMDVFIDGKIRKGEIVHVVDFFDPDQDIPSLSLSGIDSQYFDILKDGQIVSLLDSLLMKSFYTLTVTVEDSGRKSAAATFTFYVDDAIFPSFLPMAPVQIPENVLQIVATFNATTVKPFPHNLIRYSILAGNDGSFEIGSQNGVLSVIRELDRERKDFYRIWVMVSDSDVPSKSSIQSLEIRVLDQNDRRPIFSQAIYRAKIGENEEPQDLVSVVAMDEDLGRNAAISYRISFGNEDGLFGIDERGKIRSLVLLDREKASLYKLTVTATDNGHSPQSSEALVLIEVEDEDDNSPKFTRLFHAEIPEDLPIGSEIILVSVTDIDGSSHNFSLEEADEIFEIDRTSGLITLRKELDREKTPSYRLRVRLEDGVWNIFTSVQVTVTDVNDNAPIFEQKEYVFSAVQIGKVLAKDLDEGRNGEVSYSLLQDNPFVTIDALTGELKVLQQSPKSLERVTVIARDLGIPSRASETIVCILFGALSHSPPLVLLLLKNSNAGEVVWKLPENGDYLLSSPYFKLSNRSIKLAVNSKELPLSDIGTLALLSQEKNILTPLAVKLFDEVSSLKFITKDLRLLLKEDTEIGTRLGKLEVKGEGWRKLSINSDRISVDKNGELFLAKEFGEGEYNFTAILADLRGEKADSSHIILEVIPTENKRIEGKIHPLLYLKSLPSCLPFSDLISTSEEVIIQENNCLEFPTHIPSEITLSNGQRSFTLPIMDSALKDKRKPRIQQVSKVEKSRKIGTKLLEIEKEEDNCSIAQETGLQGFCIANGFLEICSSSSKPMKTEQLLASKITCPNTLTFIDIQIVPFDEEEFIPSIFCIRENLPPQKIARLGDQKIRIIEPELKKLFSITDENTLSSLTSFNREERSFYSLEVKKGERNLTLRILIDDVIDSPPLQKKNITVNIFGQLKRKAFGLIHPASVDLVHDFDCSPFQNNDLLINSSCQMALKRNPDSPISLMATINSTQFPYEMKFVYKRTRLLRLDSVLHLTFFGPSDGIAALFTGLQENFPDLKLYPISISIRKEHFYELVMGIADRHDKIVSIKEARSVIDSFLSSHPVLEPLETEKPICGNYSMRIIHTNRHLSFRGVDSLWFIPEGRLEMRCVHEAKEIPNGKVEEVSKNQPEICSKKTCPAGICSLENGKIVCLQGEEENICSDKAAISLADGHLELIPTNLFHSLISKRLKEEECNDTWISIDFRTISDGVLLSIENSHGFSSSLEILKGIATYRLSDGYRTPVEIPLTRLVTDNEWHTLSFKMTSNGRRILLEVDGAGREARTNTSLPFALSNELKKIQLGTDSNGRRFSGCVRTISFNNYQLPLQNSEEAEQLFSISAVGHISWSNGSSSSLHLSPASIISIAAVLALVAVFFFVYCVSRLYFRWKSEKGPAWQETGDIRVQHLPKQNSSSTSTSTDSQIYAEADRRHKQASRELSSFERAPTLPVRKIRTVADVSLEIPRNSTRKAYRNEGYV